MVPYRGLPDSNNSSRRGQWSSRLTRAPSSLSEDNSSKDSDDDNAPPCLATVTAAMIVLLAIVGLVLGLLMLYLSNLPPSVGQNETTTEAAYPEPATQDQCVGRDRVLTPTRQKLGAETHQGPLPGDVEPLHYAITMTLCGNSLDDAGVNLTGRVEALIRPKVPTAKLVLRASSERIKDLTMALLDRSGSPCHEPEALAIESVSASEQFLIVKLENNLVTGTAYTLVTEYHYDKTAADGPIHFSPTFGCMELKPGEAHVGFPCFEEQGWLAPVQLTLVVPGKLNAASNTALDWQPVPQGTAFAHKFTTTIPMPVDKLAWVVFPETLIPRDIIPGKVKLYAVTEDTELKKSVATAFQFLSSFFQAVGNEYLRKLDIVISASVEQDSLGLVVLKAPVVSKDMCRKVAEQRVEFYQTFVGFGIRHWPPVFQLALGGRKWTEQLLLQPTPPSWLATAGVEYLCRLAVTEEDGMLAAFHEDLKACMKADAPPSVNELLAFRMAHIIIGNGGTQRAIQNYVSSNLFKISSLEKELDMFNPHVPKDKLEPWLEGGYQVLDVERTFGSKKKIKWNDAKARPTPLATAAVNISMKLRVPDPPIAVAWLNTVMDEAELQIDDKAPLIINPAMMACYGVKLTDAKSWALLGSSMEKEVPNPLNAWYILSQAAKQYQNVKRPHDFTGYMWTWAALKHGEQPLWDEHVKQFLDTERQAYSMLVTEDEENAYKKRVLAVIEQRVASINPSKDLPASAAPTSTAVLLASLACQLGSDMCTTFSTNVENLVVDKDFQANVEHATRLAAVSVACHLGSQVTDTATFDRMVVSNKPQTTVTNQEAPLLLRLAFAACVPKGAADTNVSAIAEEALSGLLSAAEADQVRVSQHLRKEVLVQLSKIQTVPSQDDFTRTLNNLAVLHIVRTSEELEIVTEYARRSTFSALATDPPLKDIVDGVTVNAHPFQTLPAIKAWINDQP